MPHLLWILLLSILISAAIALPGDRAARDRVYAAAYTLVSSIAIVFAGSWLMFWIHG